VEAKVEPRFRKRLPCRVRAGGSSYAGMVLNLSRGGLFVQTGAGVPPGAGVVVDLDLANHPETVPIGGRVVWRRVVASHLRTVSRGGIGVRIESAPEPYYRLLMAVTGEAPGAAPSAGHERVGPAVEAPLGTPKKGFRVRVKKEGAPRSRTMLLHCGSEEEARARALSRVGEGWVILELESSA
jgi:Tfp pilus assembly protein PilZ